MTRPPKSKRQVNFYWGVMCLFAFALLIVCGCKTFNSVEKTPEAIDKNRIAIEQSTDVISRNARAVSDSTEMIESNKLVVEQSTAAITKNAAMLNEINTASDKLKANEPAAMLIIILVALLLIVPSILTSLVLWRMNKLMKLWLKKQDEILK